MKVTIRLISLVLAVCFVFSPFSVDAVSNYGGTDDIVSCWSSKSLDQDIQAARSAGITFVYTPNGSAVEVIRFYSDMPADQRTTVHTLGDSVSPNDDRLYSATSYYNCHSYAWYSRNTDTNKYWMNNPSAYYSDGSYSQVTSPAIGDIICYFDNSGTPSNYSDDMNLHSGIVVEIYSSNLTNGLAGNYTVESKWGSWGVYRHNGYECPYTNHVLTVDAVTDVMSFGSSDIADYVRFYRRTGHTHNFNIYNDTGNDEYHQSICGCGMIVHKAHNWVLRYGKSLEQRGVNYVPEYYCALCGAFSLNPN